MYKKFFAVILYSIVLSLSIEFVVLKTILYASQFLSVDSLCKLLEKADNVSIARLYYFFIFSLLVVSLRIVNREKLLRYRYLIALIVLVCLVSGKFTGSSLGFYDYMVTDNTAEYSCSTLLGVPRGTRGDEWATEKPMYFAQKLSRDPLQYFNKRLGFEGYDMVVSGFCPVKDIMILTRPDLWGFLFLSKDYAFSFYWNLRLLLLFMSVFEFIYLLGKKDDYIAFLSAIIVVFSPPIQWWLSQSLMIMVYSALFFLVCYKKFFEREWGKGKILLFLCMVFFSNIYLFTLYPAVQVPLGYIFLCVLICITPRQKIRKLDVLLLGGVLLSNFFFVSHFLSLSDDAMQIMLHTTYPGTTRTWIPLRTDYDILSLVNFLTTLKPPFVLNESELSQFWNMLIFLPFIFLFCFFRKKIFLIPLVVFFSSLALLLIAKLPACNFLREYLFFKYTYPVRISFAYGFGFLLSLLLLAPHLKQWQLLSRKKASLLAGLGLGGIIYLISLSPDTILYYKSFNYGVLFLFFVVLSYVYIGYCFLRGGRYSNYGITLLAFFTVTSTILVNPLVSGTDSMFEKKILKEVTRLNKQEEGRWMVSGSPTIANLVSALGVSRISGTYYYPDMKMMRAIDPEQQHVDFYNQYAHIDMRLLVKENEEEVLYHPGQGGVNKIIYLSPLVARNLGVKYVFTEEIFPDNFLQENKLSLLYKSTTQSWKIYKFN